MNYLPYTRITPWQVKLFGLWWAISFAEWSEWHQRDSEPSLRRAWWWLYQWPSYGTYCLRICGLTLKGKPEPHKGWVFP